MTDSLIVAGYVAFILPLWDSLISLSCDSSGSTIGPKASLFGRHCSRPSFRSSRRSSRQRSEASQNWCLRQVHKSIRPILAMLPKFSSDQLPLLVTGVAGVAGYNAFRHFRRLYGKQVLGVRPINNWPLTGDGIIGCDVENRETLSRLVHENRIRSILNCGGSCRLKACEYDPQMANRVNVRGVESLLAAIEGTDIHLVHLSIDLVFSGQGLAIIWRRTPSIQLRCTAKRWYKRSS